jgi:Uma2 family endonuclease
VYVAPLDVVFALGTPDEEWVQPDVIFITKERLGIITDTNIAGAPDLVVEVLSKSTQGRDLLDKKDLYEREGVPEYWVSYQDQIRVEIYRLGADGTYGPPLVLGPSDAITTPLLPGFSLALDRLYQELPLS